MGTLTVHAAAAAAAALSMSTTFPARRRRLRAFARVPKVKVFQRGKGFRKVCRVWCHAHQTPTVIEHQFERFEAIPSNRRRTRLGDVGGAGRDFCLVQHVFDNRVANNHQLPMVLTNATSCHCFVQR